MDGRALARRARPGRERADARRTGAREEAEKLSGVAAHPLVRKVMEKFPGAKIVDVRNPDAPPQPAAPEPADEDADFGYADTIPVDDDF